MDKRYLSEVIGDEYFDWGKRKIIIQAPTGCGKSTFIIRVLLKRYQRKHWKLLILCNRRLLRKQYWYQLVQQFETYADLRQVVEIKTYQELAASMMHGIKLESVFEGYAGICLDEVHYFYADSDFNGFGTYVLFQAIMQAGIDRQMIFMSATMDCIKPFITKAIRNLQLRSYSIMDMSTVQEEAFETVSYSVESNAHEYIRCFCVPDLESLCKQIAKSTGKSLVFWDDKTEVGRMADILSGKEGVKSSEICCLNADDMDKAENSGAINALVLANKLAPKVLLTTSVLDNGVSIHDQEVENIAIITESKVSFLQMLGRVRSESTKGIKLYFVLRSASYFARREQELKRVMEAFDKFEKCNLYRRRYEIMCEFWNKGSERADLFRRLFVLEPEKISILGKMDHRVHLSYGDMRLAVNGFSREKTGDSYLAEAAFRQAAECDPLQVVYAQMRWIDKTPDELRILDGHIEEERKEFIDIVLGVQNYTKEQLKEVKEMVVERFRKSYLSRYGLRNRTFSLETFSEILANEGLRIDKKVKSGKTLYTVVAREEEEES